MKIYCSRNKDATDILDTLVGKDIWIRVRITTHWAGGSGQDDPEWIRIVHKRITPLGDTAYTFNYLYSSSYTDEFLADNFSKHVGDLKNILRRVSSADKTDIEILQPMNLMTTNELFGQE